VLTSQEKWRITPKEGRLIVHKPFAKGTRATAPWQPFLSCHNACLVVTTSVVRADQYPMYRETNWKYTSPCMCCLHASVLLSSEPTLIVLQRGGRLPLTA
jgi:hypothetical protein